jgi:hypothetical protein
MLKQIDLVKLDLASMELRRLRGKLTEPLNSKITKLHEDMEDLIVKLVLYINQPEGEEKW